MTDKVVDLEFKPQDKQKKIKILTISDHPLSPSGVGTQTKYFIAEMLKTGKFEFCPSHPKTRYFVVYD